MLVSAGRLKLKKARVLVVEDNAQSMNILSQILLGFGVTQARKCTSAAEAREPSAREPFDLILVDQELRNEDGLAFCREVRADPKTANFTTAIIVFTALPSEATIQDARDAGANFVVVKPIVPTVLLQRMEWIARENRAFVSSDNYRGPDRRFRHGAAPDGIVERRADALRLMSIPERALSQDEINSLFG